MPLTILDLNQRSLDIFRELVDAFVETGEPVGSRTISRRLSDSLSPATIRNIMSDLEEAGLLYAPHVSAGRLPTEAGLRFFVHGLLEVGCISPADRMEMESRCRSTGRSVADVLEEATTMLSGLSQCAGLVMAPKTESPLKHVEFVHLEGRRALVVLITEEGVVENRIIDLPLGMTPSALIEAGNYLNARLTGRTLAQSLEHVLQELRDHKANLDKIAEGIVQSGLGVWSGNDHGRSLIIRGQSNLLQNVTVTEDLNRIKDLFNLLDKKEGFMSLLDASIQAPGVQIFIGTENKLFDLAGCALVVAPYQNSREQIVGAIGVVGPTRMDYGRIIPLVDYTAKLVGKVLG